MSYEPTYTSERIKRNRQAKANTADSFKILNIIVTLLALSALYFCVYLVLVATGAQY